MIACPKCGSEMRKNGRRQHDGKQRYVCFGGSGSERIHCYSTCNPDAEAKVAGGHSDVKKKAPVKFKRKLGGVKRLVVTSAQNATPVNKDFLASLEAYCAHNDAELIVIPYRYRHLNGPSH